MLPYFLVPGMQIWQKFAKLSLVTTDAHDSEHQGQMG